MTRLALLLSLGVLVSACGSSSSPTAPTPAPVTPTKIISVSGNLAFGSVNIGSSASSSFTIGNSGNTTLTFTSLNCTGGTGPTGYTATPTSGSVPPGGNVTVAMRFAPTTAGFLSCVLSVVGDQTAGGAAINVSCTGVNPNPIFVRSGVGNTVFDLPTYVGRIHIVGTYIGTSSNFIVHIAGDHIVNDLLGTEWPQTVSDGTYVTHGGVVEILSSTGVSWSFTEVR